MQTVLITGGTGLVGSALTKKLVKIGYEVVILTRSARKDKAMKNVSFAEWDVEKGTVDTTAIQRADFIIHLAGANVAGGRWTKKRKQEIVSSRVDSGRLLVKTLSKTQNKIKAVISASAIGWYGPDKTPPVPFTENDPADNAFLGTTCQQWESSIESVKDLNIRLVKFRIGIVLSNNGGTYVEFKKPLNFGTATILGNGKQIISWIHIDDLVQMFIYALENEKLTGVYNAVAPFPVSNKQMILAIAKARGKFFIPVYVPAIALKIALGGMSIEVLKSTTISSKKIQQEGYTFLYPKIEDAVKNLNEN